MMSEPPDPLATLGSDVTEHRLTRPDGRIEPDV